MTHAEHLLIFLSANDAFKNNYGKYLRWSLLVALVLTCLLLWLMPRYEPTPYVLREKVIVIIDVEVEYNIPEPEQPLSAPKIVRNLEPVKDTDETPHEFIETSKWPTWNPPIRNSGGAEEETFLPSSANPRLLFQAKPEYTQIARMSGLEGTVIVNVLVGPWGDVENVVVARGVHPLLNQAAVQAAYRCRFEPGTQRSMPVKSWVAVPYRFRLR